MAKHVVCITFDFDAVSGFIAKGLTSPTPVSRGEFGAVAVPRILELLHRFGISSTWFIPGHTLETYPSQCRLVSEGGHEIAHHGWTHIPPNEMTCEEEERDLIRGNDAIRKLTGRAARGYRSPSWDLSPHSVELLLKHGFLYDSSMMGNDYSPYRVRKGDVITLQQSMKFGKPTSLIELPVSWSLDDFPHFEFLRTKNSVLPGLMDADGVLANWLGDYEYMRRHLPSGMLTYTFHPFVIGRGHRMILLEKLLQRLLEAGAQFATMEEAAVDYARHNPYKEDQ